jgi:poly-gamma-glutamate capsule biosynthesis protein CapA/YwtB (metallophosphatase superfamily)
LSPIRRLGAFLLAALALGSIACASIASAARRRPDDRSATFEWVGDIALSAQRGLPPGGLYSALAPVRGMLRDAQLTAGNLEGTLSSGGVSKCSRLGGNCFAFQAPAYVAGQLRGLGFDLVNQANNHSMDFGASGRAQTLSALRAAGIAYTGLPGQVTYRRVGGIRVAFLGFAPYAYDGNLLDIGAAAGLVRRARAHASLVIVIIHAGAEGASALHTPFGTEFFLGENRGDPRAFAHAVIRAGAAMVLGSGPHVIRGIEHYRGRLIAYSLGNFVGYHTLGGGGLLSESGVLRVTLDPRGRVIAGQWLAIRLLDGLPRPDPGRASVRLVARLSNQDFPRDHFRLVPDGEFLLPDRHL